MLLSKYSSLETPWKSPTGFFYINCWNKFWSKSISEETEQAKEACLSIDSNSLSIMKSSGVFLLTIHQLRQVKNDLKLKIFSLLYFLRHKMCLNIFLTSAKMFIFTVFFIFFFFFFFHFLILGLTLVWLFFHFPIKVGYAVYPTIYWEICTFFYAHKNEINLKLFMKHASQIFCNSYQNKITSVHSV